MEGKSGIMISYAYKNITCKCCGIDYKAKLLKGFYNDYIGDLDSYPNHPASYDAVIMCPNCGYVTDSVYQEINDDIRKYVGSTDYIELFTNSDFQEELKKMILWGYLFTKKGDYSGSAYAYLLAYWYMREHNTSKKYEMLDTSIEFMMKYLEKNIDIDSAIVLVDCLRQAQKYEEAIETLQSLSDYMDPLDVRFNILNYEKTLIESNDSMPHSLNEVYR